MAKIVLAVHLACAPGLLVADRVGGADEVAVGLRGGGLLQLPQIFGEPRHGRRRVEDDLGPGQPERARALGEVEGITKGENRGPPPRSEKREGADCGGGGRNFPKSGGRGGGGGLSVPVWGVVVG